MSNLIRYMVIGWRSIVSRINMWRDQRQSIFLILSDADNQRCLTGLGFNHRQVYTHYWLGQQARDLDASAFFMTLKKIKKKRRTHVLLLFSIDRIVNDYASVCQFVQEMLALVDRIACVPYLMYCLITGVESMDKQAIDVSQTDHLDRLAAFNASYDAMLASMLETCWSCTRDIAVNCNEVFRRVNRLLCGKIRINQLLSALLFTYAESMTLACVMPVHTGQIAFSRCMRFMRSTWKNRLLRVWQDPQQRWQLLHGLSWLGVLVIGIIFFQCDVVWQHYLFRVKLSHLMHEVTQFSRTRDANEKCLHLFQSALRNIPHHHDGIIQLMHLSDDAPTTMKESVSALSTQLIKSLLDHAILAVKQHWQDHVFRFYQKNLESYYPINPVGNDVPIDMFIHFFQLSGALWQFFDQDIRPFLNAPGCFSVSAYFKDKMREIKPLLYSLLAIRKQFSNAAGAVALTFDLRPIAVGNMFKRVTLTIDDMRMHYAHGPTRRFIYRWPNESVDKKVQLVCEDFKGNRQQLLIHGPWAWFKFLYNNEALHRYWQGEQDMTLLHGSPLSNPSMRVLRKPCQLLLRIKPVIK